MQPVPAAPPPPPPPRRKRWKRILLICGGVFLGLLVLAALLVPPIAGALIRSKVPALLGEALAADVALDDASFSWSGRVVLQGLRVVPRGFTKALLQVDRLEALVSLGAALGGTYVADVDVRGLRILVERDASGVFNGEPPSRPATSSAGAAAGASSPPPAVQARLHVEGAELLFRDGGRETRFTLGADAKVDGLQKPIAWSTLLTDPSGGRLSAKGDFDLQKKAGPALVEIQRLDLSNLAAAASMDLSGRLDGVLDYRLHGLPAFAGRTDLRLSDFALRLGGRAFALDGIVLTHEGGLDDKGVGRQLVGLRLGRLLRADLQADLREVLGKPAAKTRLEIDADVGATLAWLRAAGLLQAKVEGEGVVALRGSLEAFPLAWNLETTAPRLAFSVDGKPLLIEGVAHRSEGTLDEAGNGWATLSLASGPALRAEVKATLGNLFQAPAVDAVLDASSDLAELGRRFEKLLGLKTGLAGTSTLKAEVRLKDRDARVDLRGSVADLAAIDAAGKKIPLDPAIELRLAAAWDGKSSTLTAETLRLLSSFATAEGRGGAGFADGRLTVKASTLDVDVDLAGLGRKLATVLEKPPSLAGRARFHAKAEGENVSMDGTFAGLRVEGYGPLDATLKHEGRVDAKGEGRHALWIASGKALTAELEATLQGGAIDATLKADSDLGALAAALPGLVELKPGARLEGKAAIEAGVAWKDEAAAFQVDAHVEGLAAVEKGKRTEIDPKGTLKAEGRWNGKARALDLTSFALASALATADAAGGVALSPLAVKSSSFSLSADLAAIGAKLGLFLADPPALAGRAEAKGVYDAERYELTATASGLKIGTTGPIDARLTQKGTLSLAPGGGLSIETSELTSTAVEATLSGAIRKVMDPDREGELKLAGTLRPAELGKWMPELGLGGDPIPLTAVLAMKPRLWTASGSAEVKRLTLTSKGPDGKPVTKTATVQAAAFELRKAGEDLAATLKSALVEWIEADYALKTALDADLACTPKGTAGTTKLVNLEVVDAKKNVVKDPAVTLKHDIGLAPQAYEIRKLDVDSSFLKGGLSGGVKMPGGAMVFEKVKGSFRYHPDRLGAVAKPWLGGGELAGKDEKTLTLSLDGRSPSSDPFVILRSVGSTMDVDLAAYTHTGVTASGRTTLKLENGVLKTSSPLDVNKGKTELTASVDLREAKDKPQSSFDFKAKEVDANADMAPFLSSINPIFHTVNGAVAGKSTADFRLVWAGPIDPKTADWTKAAGEHLRGSGTLAVRELSISGSPAVALILQAMGEGNLLTGELTGTSIRIEKGRCEYRNMTLRLARYELRFTGWVGFDKKMELMVEMPLTPGMRKKYPNLERYTGQTLFVPLEGSASHPRLDFEAAIAEAIKRAAPALLEDALKKLLERKKKDK